MAYDTVSFAKRNFHIMFIRGQITPVPAFSKYHWAGLDVNKYNGTVETERVMPVSSTDEMETAAFGSLVARLCYTATIVQSDVSA